MRRFLLIICMLSFSTAAFGAMTWKQQQAVQRNQHRYWKHKQWKKQQQHKNNYHVVEEEVAVNCPRCDGAGSCVRKNGSGVVVCKKCDGTGQITKTKKKKIYSN